MTATVQGIIHQDAFFMPKDMCISTLDQVKKIAEDKMVDLNAFTIESAMNMVAGTARSMGINVNGGTPPVK